MAKGTSRQSRCTVISSQLGLSRRRQRLLVTLASFKLRYISLIATLLGGHDALYHNLWIILYQAIQEFGIREVKEMSKQHAPPSDEESQVQYAATESQVRKEALNSASRIAGLVRFLLRNKQKEN